MKKIVLLLLVAALAAVALYFSLSTRISEPQTAQLPGSEPTAHEPADAKAKPADLAAPDAQETAKAPEAAPTQREVRALELSANLPPEKICTLSVHANLPEGTPRDDETEIMVFGNLSDDTNVDRELALLKPDDPLPKWLIARAPIGAKGTTEIALEKRSTPVGVGMRGRYSYAEPLLAIDISKERGEASLKAMLGACVRGRLIPPSGATDKEREFAGAKLRLNSDPKNAIGLQTSNDSSKFVSRDSAAMADGSFEFRGVTPGKNLLLTGRPERLAAFKSIIDELSAGKLFEISIPLARGALALGKVVDESGAGVGGAKLEVTVEAVMWGFGGRTVRECESAADGSFALEAVAAGKSMIAVTKNGYLDSSQEQEFVEGGRVDDLVLHLASGNRIAGHVRWKEGTNCADAKVDISFDQAGLTGVGALNARFGAKGNGRSDAEGRFSITGLGKGPFSVKATAKPAGASDDKDAPEWMTQVDGIKPGTLDVELTLAPPSDVSGRVVDDTGAAVAQCTVVISAKQRNPYIPSGERREVPVNDPDGHFSVTALRPGAYLASAHDKSGAASEPLEIQLPLEADPGVVVLTLPRPATVSGRVLLPDGTPAAHAHVKQQLSMLQMKPGQTPGSEPGGDTDAQGEFKLQSLPMGALMLQATKEGFSPSEGVAVTVAPAQSVDGITITLRNGGTITGELYDDRGVPKVGARILAQMPDLRFGQLWAQSDAAGKFEFLHVAPGQWQVLSFDDSAGAGSKASGDDDSAAMSDFLKNMKLAMAAVKDGETVHVVLGAPPKNPVHVRARVTSAQKPVNGAFVSFIPSGVAKAGGAMAGLKIGSSDKDGRLEVDLDHSGGYLVTVQKVTNKGGQQSVEFSRSIPEGPDYSLELELPLGSISGRVSDMAGNALVGERVSLNVDGPVRAGTLTGGRFSELQTDEHGEFLLEWLTPGRYSVSAGGSLLPGIPTEHDPLARQVRDGIEVSEGQRLTGIDFRLHTACDLKGKVLDANGKAVAEAGIFLRDEEGRPVDRLVMTSTDAGGNFVQRGLGQGRYTVTARSVDQVSGEEVSVTLREGTPAEVELHVGGGTMLVVTLTGADGADVEASFSVIDEKGRQVNGLYSLADLMRVMTDGGFDAKHQRIGPLPQGKYTITASTADGAKTVKSVNLIGQSEKKVTLKLGS